MRQVDEAKKYLLSSVINPALESSSLDKEIKNKVKNTETWINQSKHLGDLIDYIQNIVSNRRDTNQLVYNKLKENNLLPIEEFSAQFFEKFQEFSNDKMIYDLRIGELYSGHDIAYMSRSYDTRSGISILKESDEVKAVFTKVTLEGGKYKNEWIEKGKILKHSMYNYGKHNQRVDSAYNSSIINSDRYPVYIFIKEGSRYRFYGDFYCDSYFEENNCLYFKLIKRSGVDQVLKMSQFLAIEQVKINNSKKLSKQKRVSNINDANKKPEVQFVKTKVYKRNPDVVIEVLNRANGICERCNKKAPFIRASDNTPYLEVHHIVTLANNGDDTVENAIAICPNCHRELHFGK